MSGHLLLKPFPVCSKVPTQNQQYITKMLIVYFAVIGYRLLQTIFKNNERERDMQMFNVYTCHRLRRVRSTSADSDKPVE